MTEQSIDKIISALEVYGAPMLKLYAIIAIVCVVVFMIFFAVIVAIIIKSFRDMDKDWDDFKRR